MSAGTGIALPTKRTPVNLIGKFTLALTGSPEGLHLTVTGSSKEAIRYGLATSGYIAGSGGVAGDPEPQPEPETRATRKPMSAVTKAKMRASQLKRQAELRKVQEGASETTAKPTASKTRKPKTMTAGATA